MPSEEVSASVTRSTWRRHVTAKILDSNIVTCSCCCVVTTGKTAEFLYQVYHHCHVTTMTEVSTAASTTKPSSVTAICCRFCLREHTAALWWRQRWCYSQNTKLQSCAVHAVLRRLLCVWLQLFRNPNYRRWVQKCQWQKKSGSSGTTHSFPLVGIKALHSGFSL